MAKFPFITLGLGVTFGSSLAAVGCGNEPPLSEQKQLGGADADKTFESNAGSDSTSEDKAATGPDAVNGDASGETPPVPSSFLVPAGQAAQEVTQVYNGETHVVGDAAATLRAASDEVAVYVQDELTSQVTDAQLNGFLMRLVSEGSPKAHLPDLGILPSNESIFGALKVDRLPDGKQRVFIVDTAGAGDGYLCGWCTYPDLHLDGNLVSPLDGEDALAISAHELYHAIHRGYDSDEEVWVDESLAEAAMTVNGYFTDEAWLGNFLDDPNQDWGPSGADVTSVNYGACLAFGTYLFEQGGPELMQAITKEPANGWLGLDAALSDVGETRSAWDLFLELGAALYFDDPLRGYGIRSFDLPRPLRVASLATDVNETLEAYGFFHFEVRGATRLTVAGDEVAAVFVADLPQLTLQRLEAGEPFEVSDPGVLIVTARSRTPLTVTVD